MFNNYKIACFTDIHLGEHNDSPKWHKISLDFAKWVSKELKDKKISDIVLTGDVFHNRNEINVSTIDVASEFFNILKDFNIVITTGNHDCYYKNNSEINSLSILKNSKNIRIVDEYESYHNTLLKKNISFVPWGFDVANIKKSDYIFGHFELNGFRLNNAKICEHGVKSEDILNRGKHIFTGHFHHRDERKYSKGSIIYVGSPYQFNFGDANSERGYYIIDMENDEFEFVENTISPKHIKLRTSQIYNDKKINLIKEEIENNIVRLIVDSELKDSEYNKITTAIESVSPYIFDIKNEYEDKVETVEDFVIDEINVSNSIDEYIEIIEIKNKEQTKEYLKEKFIKFQK